MTKFGQRLRSLAGQDDFIVSKWFAGYTGGGGKPKTTIDINRKGSIVKEKCRQLTENVMRLTVDGTISSEDLRGLVEDYIGGDKETIRAYMGYQGAIKISKRTGEGYVVGEKRKGYLEKFGFMRAR